MKQNFPLFLLLTLALPLISTSQDRINPSKDGNVSVKLEIERAIAKGIAFLESQQDPETGAWSDPNLPALTALPVSAILGDPARDPEAPLSPVVEKGLAFIAGNAKPDGGIYGKGLATYNTSLSIMALSQAGKREYYPLIAKARRLLINQQQDFDRKGTADNLFDGGIGYGGSYAHSDLSNSHFAMEALYYSKQLLADTEFDESKDFDLDWDAAIQFVSLCQNTEKTVERLGDWAGLRKEDEGGFVYFPGDTKSDEIEITVGGEKRTALRSYGSMSYAGLLAFIYADMDRDDPRIEAALEWLSRNYTLEENPGMDAQGLFYYYHTMAKALSIARINKLTMPGGKTVDWRVELAVRVMGMQERDGSWVNGESNRWMEDDRTMVTAYALLALEHIYRGL